MNINKFAVIFAHAVVGWALCGGTIAVGKATTTMENTLVIHAIATPIFFAGISLVYFRKFNFTAPLLTAILFTGIAMALDFFIVAPFIEKSMAMFASLLGTWIPFALIFASTYLTGVLSSRMSRVAA